MNIFISLHKIQYSIKSIPSLENSHYPDITPLLIEVNGVRLLLQNLDSHKAQDSDGIPARFLKETSNHIAPVLTLIFNASIQQGKLPTDWKKAFVVPVFKKGSRTDPSNYRPISLTCICYKIFEHIIVSNPKQPSCKKSVRPSERLW